MTPVKEPRFFAVDSDYGRGLDYYAESFFAGASSFPARGESTPSYLYSESAAARIASDLPPSSHRFIVLLRDPVARAYSMYWHMRRTGHESLTFEDALEAETERLADPEVARTGSFTVGYVYCGSYAQHLSRYRSRFGPESVLVLFHEDLEADPVALLKQACRHVGVDDHFSFQQTERRNVSSMPRSRAVQRLFRLPGWMTVPYRRLVPLGRQLAIHQLVSDWNQKPFAYPPIAPETERVLRARFASGVRDLEAMTGRDLSHWRRPA
jgi:hypothetical protein